MNICKSKKSKPAPANTRTFGPTKKHKNTYIIRINGVMADPSMFCMCKMTPLMLDMENGERNPINAWSACKQFPNPGAQRLIREYNYLRPFMGQTAATVIEYLDYKTGAPVMYVFPTEIYIMDGYETNYEQHLNHATRRDLNYQKKLREGMINLYRESVR